jgi:hypothetical protein
MTTNANTKTNNYTQDTTLGEYIIKNRQNYQLLAKISKEDQDFNNVFIRFQRRHMKLSQNLYACYIAIKIKKLNIYLPKVIKEQKIIERIHSIYIQKKQNNPKYFINIVDIYEFLDGLSVQEFTALFLIV